MKSDTYRKRVLQILDFVTEITLGNYTYRLDIKNHKDDLEEIVLSLNLMVEEIDTVVHQINHEKSTEIVESAAIIMDANRCIVSFSENLQNILKYNSGEVIGRSINVFISEQSKKNLFPEEFAQILGNIEQNQPLYRLELIHKDGYIWVCDAHLHSLKADQNFSYCLSVFKSVHRNERIINYLKDRIDNKERYPSEYRSLLLQDKRKVLRKLHAYILSNLDTSLPSMKILARTVGGSQSKLKTMFKEAYGDTIFKYHKRKRLEKSAMLLRDTVLPIGQIAETCGFVSFPHFTRSFKKEYGINPSEIRKL